MAARTVIYLLRHAESQPDPRTHEADWPLSERGHEQALSLVDLLRSLAIEHVYSSPYRRALDTVQPFAARAGLDVRIHPDLRERALGGGRFADLRAAVRRTWDDFSFAHPGGESNRECQERVVRAVAAIAQAHPGARVLVSSHGNAVGLFLNSLDGGFGFEQWAAMRNPDLFRIGFFGDAATWDRAWTLSNETPQYPLPKKSVTITRLSPTESV